MAETPVTITLNGRAVTAVKDELLIEAAGRAGEYIPRFCYHPRMEPVGVCRMCLVEVDGPRGATLQPACYLKVSDGMTVITDSDKVRKAQDGVLEFLLANHPLDCPVCDKGGECPLQDQTLAHGSGETRFIEEKRHHVKPISIGSLVLLDRERCIQCSRCTRFAAEVAGDAEIAFAGRGDLIEVAPSPEHPFDSVFSGNTVQICPVGALTAKPYRFSARPWDLDQVESSCTTCAVQCRVAVQSSGNRLTRVLGVDSDAVNHGWLCDKGRFAINSVDGNEESTDILSAATRLREPMIRVNNELVPTTWSEALHRAAEILQGDVGVIGGASLTNEGAFAWERVARGVLRTDHIDAQFGDGLDAALVTALPAATIDDAAHARVILTLTGDLREELPVLFLRLREAVTKNKSTLISLVSGPSVLYELATVQLPIRPTESAAAAAAIAGASLPADSLISEHDLHSARELLGDGTGVVIVAGRTNLAEDASFVETALRTLATALPRATFLPALRRGNIRGAIDMGLAPSVGAGRRAVDTVGRDTLQQLAALRDGTQRAVLLLGGCVLGNVLDVAGATEALHKAGVVAVTGHGGKTLAYADVVLPARVAHERAGTVTNLEGRLSSVSPKVVAPSGAWDDVAIAAELAEALGQHLGFTSVSQVSALIEESTGYPTQAVVSDPTVESVLITTGDRSSRRELDPMAFPGVRSAELVGLGAATGATMTATDNARALTSSLSLDTVSAGRTTPDVRADQYSLSLSVSRALYDNGIAMQGSPALLAEAAPLCVRVHHTEMDRMGTHDGDLVTLQAPGGTLRVPVIVSDAVPRGVAHVSFGARNAEGQTISSVWRAEGAHTLVRLESA
jgi:NADH-quinone oxidoreductase subunit G